MVFVSLYTTTTTIEAVIWESPHVELPGKKLLQNSLIVLEVINYEMQDRMNGDPTPIEINNCNIRLPL